MTKRHSDALAVWAGACNPSAIANGILEACREMRANGEGDTSTLCNDAAVRVMVYQLAYLTGVITGAEELARQPSIAACVEHCQRQQH